VATLEARALTRCFGTRTVIAALTFAVDAGEVFSLLGPNGAGKTTTIKLLTTLLPPTAGTASVAGFDIVREATAVRRMIGYVPQLLSADGALTGYENLLVFARLYDIPRHEQGTRIREVLAFIGLESAADRLVREYSGGMIRRLEIAQAMLHRPRVLFLDEPTVGLDPLARETVWEHVQRLRADYGTTIVLTTHYMDEADRLSDRVAILHDGRLAAIGSPSALKASVGGPETTLEDVFAHYTTDTWEAMGAYREIASERRTARRLG
jgi:ABC-2 type transport system ATP-binding protein